jgi:tetratricopeptide (TPR) repeat protein
MSRLSTSNLSLSLILTVSCLGFSATDVQAKTQSPPAQNNSSEQTAAKQDGDNTPATAEAKALVEYNKGVELFQIAQIQRDKGNLPGQKQLLKESIKHFELALASNARMVEAQSNIGFAYLTLKDHKKAIGAFETALAINPQHLNTLNGLSTAYAFDGKLDQAIQTFDKLTTLDPGNSQYYFNKGSVLQKAGRTEEARIAYEQALKIHPNDQRALFNLGTLLENMGKLDEARPYYEKAKGVEIGNTIGLEAIRRLEAIDATQKTAPK